MPDEETQKRLLHPSFNERDGTLQHYFRPDAQNDQRMFPNLHAARLCCRKVTFLLLTGLIAGRRGYLQDKTVWRNSSFNKSEVVLCKTKSFNQRGPIAMEWPLTCCWPVLQEQEDHFPSPVCTHCQTRKLKTKAASAPFVQQRDGTLQHYFRPAAQNDQRMFPNLHAARLCCRRVTFLLLTGLIAGRRGCLQDKTVWWNPSFNKSEVVLCKTGN